MSSPGLPPLSGAALRREVNARGRACGSALSHELSATATPSVVFAADAEGGHGNFLRASYRRIVTNPDWAARLEKTYTASPRMPRATDRWRGELECASSSDALLMNTFCYPGVLRRSALQILLSIEPGLRPSFGVRAELPMLGGEQDRTEFDMRLGSLLVEAKLTEGGFSSASRDRLLRYTGVTQELELDDLPWRRSGVAGYQIIRGALALSVDAEARYLLLCDGRRHDLVELWFQVLRCVRRCEVRSRMTLLSWQELSGSLPPILRKFLADRYGILPTQSDGRLERA